VLCELVELVDWPEDIGCAEDCGAPDSHAEDGFAALAFESFTCVCVSVFIEPSEPTEVVVIRVTTAEPEPDADGSVTIETVRPTATSDGTEVLEVSWYVCSRPSEPTTTMLFPAS